jgi:hypothetical protein
MRFRFRLGPFTFGRGGTRLSLWRRGAGISIPLFGKGRTFGKVSVGPVRGYFGGSSKNPTAAQSRQADAGGRQQRIDPHEAAAIEAFGSDQQFQKKLQNYGVPWRGIQERLKDELPERLSNRDDIAHRLTPTAMVAVFGPQNTGWKTEKRQSKSGKGFTTWIVIIDAGA